MELTGQFRKYYSAKECQEFLENDRRSLARDVYSLEVSTIYGLSKIQSVKTVYNYTKNTQKNYVAPTYKFIVEIPDGRLYEIDENQLLTPTYKKIKMVRTPRHCV